MGKPFDVSKFRKEITKSIDGLSIGFNDPTDWISWIGTDSHGAYNEGTENRYTLQITGIIRGLNPR